MSCPLCGGAARPIFQNHPGFQAPHEFSVFDCPHCDSRFAWPLASVDAVYEQIYRNPDIVPGYDRYRRYADALNGQADALATMAKHEDVYWGIAQALDGLPRAPGQRLKILEIGCGLGYLTAALRQAGHDCCGVDLSAQAVGQAVVRFGPHYQVADIAAADVPLALDHDVVIATEVIEHLVDPQAFITAALRRVRPGGALVITTPNKDLYPAHWVWHTDPAPVHLWWFSKSSVRFLAWAAEAQVRFIDFSGFYQTHRPAWHGPTKPQTFDAQGRVVFQDGWVNSFARHLIRHFPAFFPVIGRIFLRKMALLRARTQLGQEGLSLCAVITRRAPGSHSPHSCVDT